MTLAWLWEDQISMLRTAREGAWQAFAEAQAIFILKRPIAPDSAASAFVARFLTMATAAYALDEDFRQAMIYLHVAAEFGEKLLTLDGGTGWHFMDMSGIGTRRDEDGNLIPVDPNREQEIDKTLADYNRMLGGEIIKDGKKVGLRYFSDGSEGAWSSQRFITCALAAGDMALAKRIAEASRKELGFRLHIEETKCYARILRSCILGDEAEAEKQLEKLLKAEPPSVGTSPFKILGPLCCEILKGNQQEAQTHLERYLEWHHKEAKPKRKQSARGGPKRLLVDEVDLLLAIPGLAMCRFAAMKGIPLEVDDQYLPRTILAEPPVLDSYAETYIQKALSEWFAKEEKSEQKKSFLSRFIPGKHK